MATPSLAPDFKEFLRLLDAHGVEYLLVGGYAVGFYGYPRTTGDMDVWIAARPDNAKRVAAALREFGFEAPSLSPSLFLEPGRIVRMGVPPMRIEIFTAVSGISFESCYPLRTKAVIDGIPVSFLDVENLKKNKRAAGRHKDLDDLEHLP